VDNLRRRFELDYSASLDKIKSIEDFVESRVQKSEILLTDQIESIEAKFEERLHLFEEDHLQKIVDEQARINENLDEFIQRVENLQLKQNHVSTGSTTNTSLANSILHIYGSELGYWL